MLTCCPFNGEAQIDGYGIEGVDSAREFDAELLVERELAGHVDQGVREIGIDAPNR